MPSNQDIIKRILGSETNDKTIRMHAILKVLNSVDEKEKVELLSIILTERDSVPKNTDELKEEGLSEEEWHNTISSLNQMIDGHLKNAFFKSRSVKEFSAQLIKLLSFFETETEQIICLAKYIYSPYIPFKELPGEPVRLTDEKYMHLLESNKEKIQMIKYICNLPFFQKMEEISHLLHILSEIDDHSLECALLSYYCTIRDNRVAKQVEAIYNRP